MKPVTNSNYKKTRLNNASPNLVDWSFDVCKLDEPGCDALARAEIEGYIPRAHLGEADSASKNEVA